MGTFTTRSRFIKDLKRLTEKEVALFVGAAKLLSDDLDAGGKIRPKLRVKQVQSLQNHVDGPVYELSWSADGRAFFRYGAEVKDGKRHVEWLRIGSHDELGISSTSSKPRL